MVDLNGNTQFNTIVPQNNSHPKKLWILFAIIIVLIVAGFFVWQYITKNHLLKQPYTEEEKMDIAKSLRTDPPEDGSVLMTQDQKLDILNNISNKPADPSIKRRALTEEEQQKIFDSLKQ